MRQSPRGCADFSECAVNPGFAPEPDYRVEE